jgi:hypothetical protein
MPIQECSPRAVAELFNLLSPEDQVKALIQMTVTAEHVWRVVDQLPPLEQYAFSELLFNKITWMVFPIIIDSAIRVFRQSPDASDEELHTRINEQAKQTLSEFEEARDKLATAKEKQRRDRKPDPTTIRRNLEICDLRRRDPQKWSLKKLARKYKVSRERVHQILKDESEWLRLQSTIPDQDLSN